MGGNFKSFEQEMVAQRRTQWTHISQSGLIFTGCCSPGPVHHLTSREQQLLLPSSRGTQPLLPKSPRWSRPLGGTSPLIWQVSCLSTTRRRSCVSAISGAIAHKQIMQIYSRMCLQSPGASLWKEPWSTRPWYSNLTNYARSFWRSGIAGGVSHFASTASFERTSRSFWLTFPWSLLHGPFCRQKCPNFPCLSTTSGGSVDPSRLWTWLGHNFERILHASWNGFVGGAWSAPPCREYSRLKLKRPGPKPVRTPSHPYGLPSLNASEQLRLQTQETIHDRGRSILHAVHCKGGLVGWETPPTAMTLLLDENTEMLRGWNATCSHVAACRWGKNFSKAWLMCANTSDIAALASWCDCKSPHPSFAGVRTQTGAYLSSQTAEYPASLALELGKKMHVFSADIASFRQWWRWRTKLCRLVSESSVRHFWGPSSTFCWIRPSTQLIPRVLQHLQHSLPEDPLSPIELNPLKQICMIGL